MRLDATKLREDVQRIAPIQTMRRRRYLVPEAGSNTAIIRAELEYMSPRGFLIGLPEDPNWQPETIAAVIREAQLRICETGGTVKVHGVYVIGVGYFLTAFQDSGASPYSIFGCTDDTRLFRFTNAFRTAFQRWPRMQQGWAGDLDGYASGGAARRLAPPP
jgi:hypothetical protein